MNAWVSLIGLLLVISCIHEAEELSGKYLLSVDGMKNATTGTLEIVGEPGDYFGKSRYSCHFQERTMMLHPTSMLMVILLC